MKDYTIATAWTKLTTTTTVLISSVQTRKNVLLLHKIIEKPRWVKF